MVLLINKIVWHVVGITLLVTGGWCVYFDQKRRKGVQEMRKLKPPKSLAKRPSKDALQLFFLQEIENGERLLVAGDLESSVEHFVNAVVVCGDPGQLMALLKQTLPRPIYLMVKSEIRRLSD